MTFSAPSIEEIAVGLVLRQDPMCPPFDVQPEQRTPRQALEEVLLDLLTRGRVAVGFSGGIDSSGLLCLATDVARRHGLDDPIAVTSIYPGVADASEDEWQEEIIRHLQLSDWVRVDMTEEAELFGPTGQRELIRFGVRWPPMLYRQVPMIEAVPGCSLVLGNGGDELTFPTRTGTMRLIARRRVRWDAVAAKALLEDLRPRLYWTGLVDGARVPDWIRREARPRIREMIQDHPYTEPFRWPRALMLRTNSPWALRGHHNIVEQGRVLGIEVSQPLTDRGVIAAMLTTGGQRGFSHRAAAAHQLYGDTMPKSVRRRQSKADFGSVVVGDATRAFIADWDGTGLSHDLVDFDRLQASWATEPPGFYTFMMLQQGWLATQASR